ncbi:MAG: Ig-like domain-containing protein, partial [Clostridia bacterium]|nr:Ig-like domain-containing protein [Clostridia bacterium]
MKRHSVLLLALLLGASSAFAAEFNVEDYTREELIAINETVDARLAELNAQYAREHANRIITLDTEAPVLGTGKNLKVTATVAKVVDEAPDKTTLVWKSSNDKVARVSNGTVTAVAPGTAEITVSAKDDENVTASFTVSVVKLVTGVQLKEKTLSVPKKSTVTPNATVQPKDATNQALVWTSSDETVATVAEDGTITGVRGGECTVTATAADGSGKSASVKVKVLGALPFEFKNFQVKEIDYG